LQKKLCIAQKLRNSTGRLCIKSSFPMKNKILINSL
jgi:hypothetical protein